MLDAELCNECVNRANLHAAAPACVTQEGCLDVGLASRIEKRENLQSLDNARLILGAIEALQKFLKHDASSYDRIAV